MKNLTLIVLLFGVMACSTATVSPLQQQALVGGAVGTVLGAGTGALVGSLIKNGNVGKSAALGAGIGLASGVLAAAAYHEYQEHKEMREYQGRIAANQYYLEDMQMEIGELRQRLQQEADELKLDNPAPSYQYLGPSLGNPYR
jgi:uncharacterized membrane protein YebE (DUF533 family)